MTLAEIAAAVGGQVHGAARRSPWTGAGVRRHREPVAGRALRGHRRGARRRARLRRAAVAAGAPARARRPPDRRPDRRRRRPGRGPRPAGPARRRRARADRARAHRVAGQDRHQGLPRPAAGRRRPDGRDGRATSTTRSASRSPCCAPRPRPGTSSSRWARAASATSPSCAGSRRRTSPPCSTSAPPTSASSAPARRSPRPRARSSRRSAADGTAVLNADDPLVAAMARPHPRAGAHLRRAPATCAGATLELDELGRPSFDAGARRRRWRAVQLLEAGAHQVANAAAAAAMALAAGVDLGRHRRVPSTAARSLSPLADGAARARRRRGRRQRRLQRQPGLDGGRARRARRDRPAGAAAHGGRARRDARARRRRPRTTTPRWAGTRPGSASTSWSPSATRRRRSRAGARRTPGWRGEAVPTAGREQAADWLRHNVVARDVVLVKASRGAALEHVADAPGRCGRGRPRIRKAGPEPMKAILLGGGLALLFSLLGTRAAIPLFTQLRLRPGDPRRRPDQPPHQARYARPWAASSSSPRRCWPTSSPT